MPSIIFWLIVVPVTLAFLLGFTANLFRTIAEQATKNATTQASPPGESSMPLPSVEVVEEAGA